MAGENRIWDAFFAQTGAVRANSLEEIIDIVLAFQHLRPLKGRKTLIFGFGGGNSVAYADICGRQGLEIPQLSDSTRDELNSFIYLAHLIFLIFKAKFLLNFIISTLTLW